MSKFRYLLTILFIFSLTMIVAAQAAPDRDNDGVPDANDRCISDPGPASNNGCPVQATPNPSNTDDRDGDGTVDVLDRCPDEGGPAQNAGCPEGQNPDDSTDTTAPVAQAQLPSTGACVMATAGTQGVRRRAIPALDGDILGIIQPDEIYPVNYSIQMLDGLWFNTTPHSFVFANTIRLGGDCTTLPTLYFENLTPVPQPVSLLLPAIQRAQEAPEADFVPDLGEWLIFDVPYPDPHPCFYLGVHISPDGHFSVGLTPCEPFSAAASNSPAPLPVIQLPTDGDPVDNLPIAAIPEENIPWEPLPIASAPINPDDPSAGFSIGLPPIDPEGYPMPPAVISLGNVPDDDIDLFGSMVITDLPPESACDLLATSSHIFQPNTEEELYVSFANLGLFVTMPAGTIVRAWAREDKNRDISWYVDLQLHREYPVNPNPFTTMDSGISAAGPNPIQLTVAATKSLIPLTWVTTNPVPNYNGVVNMRAYQCVIYQ